MTPILQGLAQGYSAQQILKFMEKRLPKLSPKIAQAAAQGYTADQILKFVNKMMESETFDKNATPNEIHAAHQKKNAEIGKKILGTAAGALGVTAFARQIPGMIRGALTSAPGYSPPGGPSPMSNAPVSPPPVSGSPAAQNVSPPQTSAPSSQPQPGQLVSPSLAKAPQTIDSIQIVNDLGIGSQIRDLHSAGHTPEAISTTIGTSLKPQQRKWLDEQIKAGTAKSLPDLVSDYVGSEGTRLRTLQEHKKVSDPAFKEFVAKKQAEGKEGSYEEMLGEFEKQQKNKPTGLVKKIQEDVEKMDKGSIVALPSGEVGTIHDLKKEHALVEEGGKLHQAKISDLQRPDESVVETVARLLEIPEIERSSNIRYSSYDPVDNDLIILFHNGATYKYLDVPEELAEELRQGSTPTTAGKNPFGAWSPEDTSSRGAAAAEKLINNPKYKKSKKGEPPNPNYRKIRTEYDYFTRANKQKRSKES